LRKPPRVPKKKRETPTGPNPLRTRGDEFQKRKRFQLRRETPVWGPKSSNPTGGKKKEETKKKENKGEIPRASKLE